MRRNIRKVIYANGVIDLTISHSLNKKVEIDI